MAPGAEPVWWREGDMPAVDEAIAPSDRGPANVGQAKWMAKSALDALRSARPDIAATVDAALVGAGKPLVSWDAPALDSNEAKSQYAPLLVGQLKAISAPFYAALHAAEPAWLLTEMQASQTRDGSDSLNPYPWTSASGDDRNTAPANLAQLKAVFSLRFESLPP
ncbi:hypothetical protein [Luteolibacter sp. Populi]|uniref:hypothetical protein n=1 Tax=Luteolibacter sp. Populi TaxID=3230487 RepID=UPI00346698CD